MEEQYQSASTGSEPEAAVDEGHAEPALGEPVDETPLAEAETPVEEPDATPAGELEPTGDPEVDAVLDRLAEVEGMPTTEHVELYEDAHRRLHETLLSAAEDREQRPDT